MPGAIDAERLRALQDGAEGAHAQVLEVLPDEEYRWAHLPGALHLPLKQLDGYSTTNLDPARPVIAYCNDFL